MNFLTSTRKEEKEEEEEDTTDTARTAEVSPAWLPVEEALNISPLAEPYFSISSFFRIAE